jgi:dipeptidyl aminopeptidase/acylaminoacyl peptidase
VSSLWLHDGSAARRYTTGPSDSSPRWSPDGSRLAFLRKGPGDDDRPQVAVLPVDGGEARVVTDVPLGVRAVVWSPDGRWIAALGTVWADGLADLTDEERRRRPRRITEIPFRADDEGEVHDRRTHVWLVDPSGETPARCLTPGPHDEAAIAWEPDGAGIVFTSRRHATREQDPQAGMFRVDVRSEAVTEVLPPGGWQGTPTLLPDGRLLVCGHVDAMSWPAPMRLLRREPDGTVTDVAADLDRDLAPTPRGPLVTDDGTAHLLCEDRGRTQVVAVRPDGTHDVVVDGKRAVTGFDVSTDGRTLVVVASEPGRPGEVLRVVDGVETRLTDLSATLLDACDLVPTQYVTFERDGVELDAWVLVPEGDDVPLLLNIHGGPTAQYGFGFFDEFAVYAAAGYAVVGINPHGSSGRGAAWSTAVVGAWHEIDSVDMLDLRAAVDAVLERFPNVSRQRIGIMGGSYGGYATARILARDDRFRSAVVERGLLNWVSFGGTSDIGAYFDRMFLQAELPADASLQWQASPVAVADRITTPTLVLHSDADHRCPLEQAEQLFSILRRNGVESELLVFPGESHELSRSGSPKHRLERFEAVLDWHDRHLGVVRD